MQGSGERGSKLGLSPWSGGERGCVWIRLVLGSGWDQHRHSPAAQERCTSQDAPQSSTALTGCGKMGSEAVWGDLFKSGPVEEVG